MRRFLFVIRTACSAADRYPRQAGGYLFRCGFAAAGTSIAAPMMLAVRSLMVISPPRPRRLCGDILPCRQAEEAVAGTRQITDGFAVAAKRVVPAHILADLPHIPRQNITAINQHVRSKCSVGLNLRISRRRPLL